MKTVAKISVVFLAMALMSGIITSCKKDNQTQTAKLTVRMTDTPANYTQVNVDIIGLDVNYNDSVWMSLPINAGVYNLLDLQNNVSVVLANNVTFPAGNINQIRLILGNNNSVVVDSTGTHPLTVPSGSDTGLKININHLIVPYNTIEILLDFDANASVVVRGNGYYQLKPVIKVLSITQY